MQFPALVQGRFLIGRIAFLALCLASVKCPSVAAQAAPGEAAPIFPRIRALSLPEARALALKRSPAIALSSAKIAAAEADRKDVARRIKIDTTGGLDPFSGQVRFYLALDLERLAGLNRAQKENARQKVEAERIGAISTQQDALKRVSSAWYALNASQMSVESNTRRREMARALYVAADASFKAGEGQLSGVLSSLAGTSEADDAFQTARQNVALGCLELAQSCGYMTAEEMEAALP